MFIGSRQKLLQFTNQSDIKISINDNELKLELTSETFRIIVDENLLWKSQIDSTSEKISKQLKF